jgi:DNA-directed RNA polymerase subunit RPC12/RpoP
MAIICAKCNREINGEDLLLLPRTRWRRCPHCGGKPKLAEERKLLEELSPWQENAFRDLADGIDHREENFCPICGQNDQKVNTGGHQCAAPVLAAIDGSHSRNPDSENPKIPPESNRLVEGLKMLGAYENGAG